MNILFIGDIFASAGRNAVAGCLQEIISSHHIDLAVANAENAAGGFGLTPLVTEELLSMGLDVLTSGNHIWDKRELMDYLPRQERLLRPANYSSDVPGRGVYVTRARNGVLCAIINLQGRTHMPITNCPFREADRILAELDPEVKIRFVDFHAEATSEKMALGWYLDGRVTALLGTHTHIATSDTRVLPGGTAYQTDVGMTGVVDSILGMAPDVSLRRLKDRLPAQYTAAAGRAMVNAVYLDIDRTTGKCIAFERIRTFEPEST